MIALKIFKIGHILLEKKFCVVNQISEPNSCTNSIPLDTSNHGQRERSGFLIINV